MTARRCLCALTLLVACVPATDDLSPSGAAGFALEPTAATRGEPYLTSDGYRITFERVVLLGNVSVGPPPSDTYDEAFRTGFETVLFSATSQTPIWAGGAQAGLATLDLSSSFLYLDEDDDIVVQDDVSDVLPRFLRVAELRTPSEYADSSLYGPSLLLKLRAEGPERNYRMDLTLEASFLSSFNYGGELVEVETNALQTVPLPVRAECLLRSGNLTLDGNGDGSRAPPAFGAFARADADADGIITADELRAAGSSAIVSDQSLGDELIARTSCLLLSEEEDDARLGL